MRSDARRTCCQNRICTPSQAGFLTGLYPSSIHINRNGNAYFPERNDGGGVQETVLPTHSTMYFDGVHKLVVYQADLLLKSYNASMLIADEGPPKTMPF